MFSYFFADVFFISFSHLFWRNDVSEKKDVQGDIRNDRGSHIWVRVFFFSLCRFGSALVVVVRPRMSFSLARFFSPNDDNLGELMSNVCGCTCEGGQVWVHARRREVGDGPDPAGGRLGVHARRSGSHAA